MSLAQEQAKPSMSTHSAETIEIICHYGVGGKNQLDTAKGTFTYDMVIDPPMVIPLALSDMERKEILNAALTAGFFSMPDILPDPAKQSAELCMRPCRTYYLSITSPDYSNDVSLDTCSCMQQDDEKKLGNLISLIRSIIASKSEFKALPKPKAGYL